jgi:hypothetical protein
VRLAGVDPATLSGDLVVRRPNGASTLVASTLTKPEVLGGFVNPLEPPGFAPGVAVFDDDGGARIQFVRPMRTANDVSDDVTLDPGDALTVQLTTPGSVLAVSAQASATSVEVGEPVLLTAQPAGSPAGLSYVWDFGDGQLSASSASTPRSHPYAYPGVYRVRVTVSDAAGDAGVSQPLLLRVAPADDSGEGAGGVRGGGEIAAPAGAGLSASVGAPGAPPATPPPPPPPAPRPAPDASRLATRRLAASLREQAVPRGRGATITALLRPHGLAMSFAASASGRVVISWYRPPSRGKARLLVARGSRAFTRAGTERIHLGPTAVGRRWLRRCTRAHLTATATFTPSGGPAVPVSRLFVLRR